MTESVLSGHDAVLLDLDGTVYRGGVLVERAAEAIREVQRRGVALRYVTNNASKSDEDVAHQLGELGLAVRSVEVSTSPQAAAAVLAELLPASSAVLVLGSAALESEVDKAGLHPVRRHAEDPVAVVQGLSQEITWSDLAEAALALHEGALWIATNMDATLPTERGELPGNGSLVAALQATSGRNPRVAGKPERPLLDTAARSAGARSPLFVGDRLDTDIAGAVRAGMPGMLVLTGVSRPADLLAAGPEQRPAYLAADLSGLHEPPERVRIAADPAWPCRVSGDVVELASAPEDSEPPEVPEGSGGGAEQLAALRSLCAARWSAGSGPVAVRARDAGAREVLARLGLSGTPEGP
ncbi:HAD-IIA family hydrolase [Salinifilum aidingensis]